ncbi:sugar phosphate isomerase/epimerase [Nocardioides marinisabuli]|uniref:Sugar phosphate isomerase/epimerase n=1 Tax=Nocardioides marinisabuli TaxID=419476 RepID=A0A7Y9JR49_9ACTN|nr:hypothetical protein [Nocardioides marinisabuli]NYD58852.1 sugar phosphate isomerase/epimerase [Nocardioides marinisabuli]
MRPRVGALGTAGLALLLTGSLSACAEDRFEAYCERVEEHRVALTEAVAAGGSDALLGVLPRLQELRDEAPRDIADEWQQVVGRLEALERALEDAGVDPASYDREAPPEDLDDQQRAAIDGAARELVRPTTVAALQAVETQVRDVCGTPLYQ